MIQPCAEQLSLDDVDPTSRVVVLVFRLTYSVESHLHKIFPQKVSERKMKASGFMKDGKFQSNLISTPMKSVIALPSQYFQSPGGEGSTADEGGFPEREKLNIIWIDKVESKLFFF